MPRTPILHQGKRVTFSIENAIHQKAKARCKEMRYSFSEYVARLLNADFSRKDTIARKFSRHLKDDFVRGT